MLSTSLKAAVRAGKINRNAADMVEAPTASTKRRDTLSPAELQEVLSLATETPYAPLYFLAAATGMREGELLALHWTDIEGDVIHVRRSLDWVNGVGATFKDTKTGRDRAVSVGPSTVAMLRQHRRDQGAIYELVFTDGNGKPMSPHGGLRSTWNRIRDAVGRPGLRIHDLRHTFASLSLGDGVPVTVVAEQLGHSTSSTTLRVYGHSLRSMQEDAAQRFDRFLSPQTEKAVSDNA